MSKKEAIVIQGARQHNLKNFDVAIPRDQFVVITGVSGSGKSSLAFDIIYAEGQRRYVESLSAYARQFLEKMNKPDVELIEGLSPAVSIEQKTTSKNPRSTVGTQTEIYDYLRLLYANVGIPHCTICNKEVRAQSAQQIVQTISNTYDGMKCKILAPIIKGKKGTHVKVLEDLKQQGFARVRVQSGPEDPKEYMLDTDIALERYKIHNIEAVIDRLEISPSITSRLTEAVETALKLGEGQVIVVVVSSSEKEKDNKFSEYASCPEHPEFNMPVLRPRNFSFNSPFGACPECDGLGTKLQVDPELVIPDPNLTIREGAILGKPMRPGSWRRTYYTSLANTLGFSLDVPFKDLPEKIKRQLLYGSDKSIKIVYEGENSRYERNNHTHAGTVIALMRNLHQTSSENQKEYYQSFMRKKTCPKCQGKKLRPEYLVVTIDGKNIFDISNATIKDALDWFKQVSIKLDKNRFKIARNILREIEARLNFLISVGLPYLTLDRLSKTLSGGESQRIRLATQIGSALVGVCYILDEPSIGLHSRDQGKLLQSLRELTDIGNTVLVVEHDHQTIFSADHIVDLGPGAGVHGGTVVAQGTPVDIMNHPNSLTGAYLSGQKQIDVPKERREGKGKFIEIVGAKEHNLKKINVKFPLGKLICITGVSGSGKSTLMNDTLYKGLMKHLHRSREPVGKHKKFVGLKNIDKVVNIDQSPIGRTPRSNPGTYTKMFDEIRKIFAQTQKSRARGYKGGRFSFNVKGGRCETCKGGGQIKIELSFLPDVWITCDDCKGKRYNDETLQVTYKGNNIAEVLNLTVEEALELFNAIPTIKRRLQTLVDVGLGYIKVGQPAPTLSGGEAQRVKLSRELSKKSTGKTCYILDEPTTGLSTYDISFLLQVLHRLVDEGNTVIVIEHNLDVIKTADWIIELGPEGGDNGGYIMVEGTPEDVSRVVCPTGRYLERIFSGKDIIPSINVTQRIDEVSTGRSGSR
ncbi:MAG: excinuclease ABC subunit UvrA [Candidatus Hodarchaeales archaeon]|jgi:excinuclease ABC subunit A